MSNTQSPIELPPEAEPAREFIEALVAIYEKRIDELEKQVQALNEKIEKLTPRNSSLPPSTEHPHAKPKRNVPFGKKRKRGGQKGHKRYLRELVPSEQCSSVTPCYPHACRRCGGKVRLEGSDPKRHQVWDLPPIEPVVNEYQLFGDIVRVVALRPKPTCQREFPTASVAPGWQHLPAC